MQEEMLEGPDTELAEALKNPDPKVHLAAVRDYLIEQLTGNRCDRCHMSMMRTGDTAALVLRLTTVLKDIEALGGDAEDDPVAEIMGRRGNVLELRPGAAS